MKMPHVRCVKTKRGTGAYYYFDTGARDARGRRIWKRLPDIRDKTFGGVYASLMGHRSRRIDLAPGTIGLADMVRLYEKSREYAKLAKNTKYAYGSALGKAIRIWQNIPVTDILAKDVREMMDELAHKPGTANNIRNALGAVYAWGIGRGHAASNPSLGVEPFESTPIPPWPVEALHAALASDDWHVRIPTALMYYTAQRVGDIVRLRWDEVKADRIWVRQQKTDKLLDIPIHAELRAILDAAPRKALTILTMRDNVRPATRTAVREWLSRWGAPRGWDLTPHGLRKNAVIALIEAGCSMAETAAISGQSLSMVEHYAKARDQGKLASAAVLRWERAKA